MLSNIFNTKLLDRHVVNWVHLQRTDRRKKKDMSSSSIPIQRARMNPMRKPHELNCFVSMKRGIASFLLCSILLSEVICASSTGNTNFIARKSSSNLFSDSRTSDSDSIRGGSIATSDASRQSKEGGAELRRTQKKQEIKSSPNGENSEFDEKINAHEMTHDEIFTTKRDGSLEVVDRGKVCTNLEFFRIFPFETLFVECLNQISERSYCELYYPESCQIFTMMNPFVV